MKNRGQNLERFSPSKRHLVDCAPVDCVPMFHVSAFGAQAAEKHALGGFGASGARFCPSCRFANDPSNTSCALCDRPLWNGHTERAAPKINRREKEEKDSPRRSTDQAPVTICPRCTFENGLERQDCGLCGERLPTMPPPQPTSSTESQSTFGSTSSRADAAAAAAARLAVARERVVQSQANLPSSSFEIIRQAAVVSAAASPTGTSSATEQLPSIPDAGRFNQRPHDTLSSFSVDRGVHLQGQHPAFEAQSSRFSSSNSARISAGQVACISSNARGDASDQAKPIQSDNEGMVVSADGHDDDVDHYDNGEGQDAGNGNRMLVPSEGARSDTSSPGPKLDASRSFPSLAPDVVPVSRSTKRIPTEDATGEESPLSAARAASPLHAHSELSSALLPCLEALDGPEVTLMSAEGRQATSLCVAWDRRDRHRRALERARSAAHDLLSEAWKTRHCAGNRSREALRRPSVANSGGSSALWSAFEAGEELCVVYDLQVKTAGDHGLGTALEWRTVMRNGLGRSMVVPGLDPDTPYVFRARRGLALVACSRPGDHPLFSDANHAGAKAAADGETEACDDGAARYRRGYSQSPQSIIVSGSSPRHFDQPRGTHLVLARTAFGPISRCVRTGPSTPGPPQPPTAAESTPNTIMVTWAPPAELHGLPVRAYVVERKPFGPGGLFEECYRGTERVFIAVGLPPRTIHIFRVAAVNSLGQGAWSRNAAFRTAAPSAVADGGGAVGMGGTGVDGAGNGEGDDPQGWIATVDGAGRRFFYHASSQQTCWTLPQGARLDVDGTFRRKRHMLLEDLHTSAALEASSIHVDDVQGSDAPGVGAPGASQTQADFELESQPEFQPAAAAVTPTEPAFTRIQVRRNELLESSFRGFALLRKRDFLRPLRVQYVGEEGIDSGGLVKDWFLELTRSLLDGNLGLFAATEDKDTFAVDPRSAHLHSEHHLRDYFRFTGRVLGKAVLDRQVVDIRLERSVLLHLLGAPVGLEDIRGLDFHRYQGLTWMLHNDITGVLSESFSVGIDVLGQVVDVELKPGGREVEVTEANKQEYVDLMVSFVAHGAVRLQLDALAEGFHAMVPLNVLQRADVGPEDLAILLLGQESIDVSSVEAVAKYTGGYDESSQQVVWFWKVFRSCNPREQRAILRFVTGLHKVPLDGFDPPFTIMRSTHEGGPSSLPRSHTCFNQLALPAYESEEELREKLTFAVENASSAFLLA